MRLIDADALSNRMYHEVFEKDSVDQKWDSGCWMRYKVFERVLSDTPTIWPDKKQGRWIRNYSRPYVYADMFWHCSECGYKNDNQYAYIYHNYCPNCGAKMER